MVFSSHLFLFYFLPLSLLVYYALSRAPQRWRNFVLIVFGYAFYGWAEPRFIPLMFGTTLLDWLISLVIAHNSWNIWQTRRNPWLRSNAEALEARRRSGRLLFR